MMVVCTKVQMDPLWFSLTKTKTKIGKNEKNNEN